jgi:hypothetical protein
LRCARNSAAAFTFSLKAVGSGSTAIRKGIRMEDFPIWAKFIIWLIIAGTVIYAVGAAFYAGMAG